MPSAIPDSTLRFGSFELNRSSGELRKRGIRVKLQDQPLQILLLLLDRTGEIVTREDIRRALWSEGTFVDFDNAISSAVRKLREALGDSSETPRFIETVSRRGYRFITAVSIDPATPQPSSVQARLRASPKNVKSSSVLIWAVPMCVTVATLVSLPFLSRKVPRRQERASRHVTSHVRDVTLSQDGKLLAYVAALAGDLPHIWVRQALGGTAIQATRGHEPDTTPDFSPDGTRIAFLSARDGGGIYIGPSLGGESKLLVRNGAAPRFSPDGNAVLYWNRQRSVFTIPVVGGSPHVVEALNSYQLATPPRWSPDGSELIFRGTKRGRAPSEHWWIVPLSGGPGRIAWLPGIERDQGQFPPVRDWRRTRDGRSWIVYSIQGADGWTLYRIEDDPGGKTRHTPEPIASGAGQLGLNSRLSEDEKLAYNTLVLGGSIYAIPQLRGRKGAGPVERLPLSEELNCHSPALSRDGRWMIYSSSNEQQSSRVILRDLRDGSERLLDDEGVGPDGVGGNSISPDGSRVTVSRRSKGRVSSILLPTAKGDSEELCENCTARGFSSDESTVLVEQYAVPGEGADSIVSCNLATNTHRVFLQDRDHDLYQASFSWDDRWVVFTRQLDMASQILIAPVRNGMAGKQDSWITLTNGKYIDDKPRFSPDGTSVYFLSNRDQHTCIWEQRLDPETKHPAGPPEGYTHLHQESFDFFRQSRTTFSVAKDKMVVGLPDVHSDLWIKDLSEGGQ